MINGKALRKTVVATVAYLSGTFVAYLYGNQIEWQTLIAGCVCFPVIFYLACVDD